MMLRQSFMMVVRVSRLIIVYPLHRRNETATNGDGSKAEGSKPLAEYHDAEKAIAEKCGLKSVDFWNDGDLNPKTCRSDQAYVIERNTDDGRAIIIRTLPKRRRVFVNSAAFVYPD